MESAPNVYGVLDPETYVYKLNPASVPFHGIACDYSNVFAAIIDDTNPDAVKIKYAGGRGYIHGAPRLTVPMSALTRI